MTTGAVLIFILMLIIVPLAVNEAGELAPALAERLVRWTASRLGTLGARERYEEEWLGNLEHVPGKVTKLVWAFSLLFVGLPKLRWQIGRREQRNRAIKPMMLEKATAHAAKADQRLVLVIDGLDEDLGSSEPSSIASFLPRLPDGLRVIVTSRSAGPCETGGRGKE